MIKSIFIEKKKNLFHIKLNYEVAKPSYTINQTLVICFQSRNNVCFYNDSENDKYMIPINILPQIFEVNN